jgi:hypothetical protein
MGEACSTHDRVENFTEIFFEKFKGRRELERLKRRWKDNIEMYVKEIVCEDEPSDSWNFLTS